MWWYEFERQLKDSFNTYDLYERCNVHSDNQKICILNCKVNADFLQDTKASNNLYLDKIPVTLNYDDAITAFRNQVNQKFPLELSSSNNKITRRVNEVGFRGGGRGGQLQGSGRWYYGRRGRRRIRGRHDVSRGRGGRYGKGGMNNSAFRRIISYAIMVPWNDGTQIELHPACYFTSYECCKLLEAENIIIIEEQ